MQPDHHPDPLHEAASHALQRAVQLGSAAATAAHLITARQRAHAGAEAERDQQARRALLAQAQAERDSARSVWAPALDPAWLRQATLIDTARTWGAALPYADPAAPWHEPAAATALHHAEDRLRALHPYAMARYDRLRADGMPPAHAMYQAAPLFARHPHAHDTPFTPRQALAAGTGQPAPAAGPGQPAVIPASDVRAAAMQGRGQAIAAAVQARARAAGRDPLTGPELAAVLDAITSLPPDLIHRIAQSSGQPGPAPARRPGPGSMLLDREFPIPIRRVTALADPGQPDPAARPTWSLRLAPPQPAQSGSQGRAR